MRKFFICVGVLTLGALIQQSPARAADSKACALLADPDTRAKMSGALETKLMFLCGQLPEGAQPATTTTPSDAPSEQAPAGLAAPVANQPGTDIQISAPETTGGRGTTQSETSIAINGSTICAAWNDSGSFVFGNGSFSSFGVSTDGGATWTDRGSFPNGPGPDHNFGDPSLVYSARDARFYYAALSDQGLSLWQSNDGCQNFTYVGAIHAGSNDDKELMAVDNNPASPHYGRIYVGWTDFARATDLNVVTFSDNGGTTWSAPVALPNSGTNGQGMWPAIAPNGNNVYFALLNRGAAAGSTQDQWIYGSTNGGVTWNQLPDIGTNQLRPEKAAATTSCGRQALNGNIRNLSSPQIAITPASTATGYVIHAVYPYDSDGTAGADNSNVFYRRSTDGGATWSAEVRLNDDTTTTDQWYPAIGANADGTLVASWYDRRNDTANNLRFERWAAVSHDGGLTWEPNFQVSDVDSGVPPLNPNFDNAVATCYQGDYDQIVVADNGTAHLVWSDDRNLQNNVPNPDVYYDQIATNRPPVADAGPDQRVECTSPSGTPVTLNGSGSSDPDGDPLTYTWTNSFGSASGQVVTVSLPLGTQTITLTVDDGKGGTDTDTMQATVQDTTVPTISAISTNPRALWPPNHKMVPVTVRVTATDTCSPQISCTITKVTSNEPINGTGDGNTAPDWEITGGLSVKLRAERAGTGNGRVYTIGVACSDGSANTATGTATVTVPKAQN